jgi:hypothetical protein
MKTLVILLLALVAATGSGFSQNFIAVQNGGTASFYTTLDSAILNAHNGDTLYLPGGTLTISVAVDKRLHLIGVGYSRELNMATDRTQISGNIKLESEAGNGSLMGFGLAGDITGGENISNYLVRRCAFSSLILSGNNTNWTLIENSIYSLGVGGSAVSNCFFFNNIFNNQMFGNSFGFNSTVFINNIFSYDPNNWSPMSIAATNSTFENNIFLHYDPVRWTSNSVFNNNLFVSAALSCSECWGMKNIFGQDIFSIFVNLTWPPYPGDIDDYHLQESSRGKTGGKNGTEEGAEVGIYGGLYPWKDGALPPNPHFQLIDVARKVDSEGNLNVRIKVEAQER